MNTIKIILLSLVIVTGTLCYAQNKSTSQILSPAEREEYIQKALQFRKQENFGEAILQLDTILKYNRADAPMLLFKGDLLLQSRLYKEASQIYMQLLPLKYEYTITQINLSYALFMNHQPLKALQNAKNAWDNNKVNISATVNYFNALLWNIKTKEAGEFLSNQQSALTPAQVLVLKARLFSTSGNYKQGLAYYDSLVDTYPDKYYIQEYAEVLLGKKEIKKSEETMKNNKNYFSANEYNSFSQKLRNIKLQQAGTEAVFFRDIAKNTRIENIIWWQQGEGKKYRLSTRAGTTVITSDQKEKTRTQFAQAIINERWNKAWSGQSELLVQLVQAKKGTRFTGITAKQTVQYQPNDRKMAGVYYSSDILNYTASLLNKNIRSNNFGYITHLMISGKTGFYSQGSWGLLNDNNNRLLFFGSLYHLLRTEPTLKSGFNFSVLHFKDSSIKNYFAPDRYLSTELFTDYTTALPLLSKFYFQLQAAAGLQKIERQSWDPAFRFQTEIAFRLKKFEASLKYQTSNVASATGAGYKFNWFTFRAAWKW